MLAFYSWMHCVIRYNLFSQWLGHSLENAGGPRLPSLTQWFKTWFFTHNPLSRSASHTSQVMPQVSHSQALCPVLHLHSSSGINAVHGKTYDLLEPKYLSLPHLTVSYILCFAPLALTPVLCLVSPYGVESGNSIQLFSPASSLILHFLVFFTNNQEHALMELIDTAVRGNLKE